MCGRNIYVASRLYVNNFEQLLPVVQVGTVAASTGLNVTSRHPLADCRWLDVVLVKCFLCGDQVVGRVFIPWGSHSASVTLQRLDSYQESCWRKRLRSSRHKKPDRRRGESAFGHNSSMDNFSLARRHAR